VNCFWFVFVRNSWSCLKLNDFVYVHVYVEVFSRFIVKRFLKDITEVKSYVTVLS
jgi:hypothetical protein